MRAQLEELRKKTIASIRAALSQADLERVENDVLGRKNGELTMLMKHVKDLDNEEKKVIGQLSNEVKNDIESVLVTKHLDLENQTWAALASTEKIDVTQPALPARSRGHFHPVTTITRDIEEFFKSMGFIVFDGPDLESDYYNFTSLNIPPSHPARDSQDTFYIKGHLNWLMRTHTSAGDVRAKQKYGAPLRMISTGKCFRNEATDVRHEHTFYQLQGVVLDKGINFSHLKGTLEALVRHLYGSSTKLRLRPKYYPFVEPGVNGEVTCFLCQGAGCRVCKQTGWLEIFGAGLIHPHLLQEGGIDTAAYQGFAFGLGLTRLVMLKYGIDDIRLLESGDVRFLEQF